MDTNTTTETSIVAFVEMIRAGLPALIEEGTDRAVSQVGDEGLLAWTANGEDAFAIDLSDGSRYQFMVRQLRPADETEFYCEGCGALCEVNALDDNGRCLGCRQGDQP